MAQMGWFLLEACRAQALRAARDGRGVVLPLTLIILLILAALVTALLATGVTEPQIASNVVRSNQALSLAEAGAERAIADFIANPTAVNCAMWTSTDVTPCTGPATLPGWTTLYGGSQSLGTIGTYTVRYQPISFATLLVESTGQTSIGSVQRTVRVVLTSCSCSKYALLANTVTMDGSSKVTGTMGAIQGNASTSFVPGSSATVSLSATSSTGPCTNCVAPYVGDPALSGSGKSAVTIPTINPASYLKNADFILGPDPAASYPCGANPGIPVDKSQILVVNATSWAGVTYGPCQLVSGTLLGWSPTLLGANKGTWSYSGAVTPPNGTYYSAMVPAGIGASITITGTTPTSWKATFVTPGTVDIAGSPTITPYLNDSLIIAGTVNLHGTVALAPSLTGVVMASSAVNMYGNVNLTGNVVSDGSVSTTGNIKVTYNVGTRSRPLGVLQVISWSTT